MRKGGRYVNLNVVIAREAQGRIGKRWGRGGEVYEGTFMLYC